MKKNGFLAFLAFAIGFNSLALAGELPALNTLNPDTIFAHKDTLIKELKRNYYIKIGIYATAAGLAGFGIYKFFAPSAEAGLPDLASDSLANVAKTSCSPEKILTEDDVKKALVGYTDSIKKNEQALQGTTAVLSQFQEIIDKDPELKKKFEEQFKEQLIKKTESPSFIWQVKDYCVYTFKSSVVMAVASMLLSTVSPFTKYLRILDKGMDSLIDRIFYHEDLNWYLATHTTLFDVLAQTEKHAEVLAEQAQPAGDFAYHFSGFADSLNISLQQLEQVLGFMSYKIGGLEKKSPLNAKRACNLTERFFSRINEQVDQMNVLLKKMPLEMSAGQSLKVKLAELRSCVQESLHAFVAIEFVSDI